MAAARRREYARSIHAVTPTADGTTVRYTADVTNGEGTVLRSVERTARLPDTPDTVPLRDLTRTWTAPWAYPILPLAIALDTAVFPLLTLMAPIVLVVGE